MPEQNSLNVEKSDEPNVMKTPRRAAHTVTGGSSFVAPFPNQVLYNSPELDANFFLDALRVPEAASEALTAVRL